MTLRNKLLSGAAALGLLSLMGPANASDTATVTTSITTDAGITAATGNTMAFGTWLIGVATGEDVTIIMNATNGGFTTGGVTNSQVVQLDGLTQGTNGSVTVTLPAGADNVTLQMTRSAITDFTDTNLELIAVSYDEDTGGPAALAAATPVDIVAESGGVAETVTFGGTIEATDTPTDAAHTATFDVTFSY